MKVPLLDLRGQYKKIEKQIMQAAREVFETQYFILGPKVESLEKEIAGYCNSAFAVGVSSGSDALLISLMAGDIGRGDMVITTAYTFFATAGSIARTGAEPVFADIDPTTYNISVQSVKNLLQKMSSNNLKKLKAIIPVHLYGQCSDMAGISEIATKYDLLVIEDAAQAIGAEFNNKPAGSMGDFGCFSFFPSKNLGAFGDAGMVTTNSAQLFNKLKIMRNHGADPKYFHKFTGGNFRLDALQAAILSVKLKYLDNWNRSRRQNAKKYRQLFSYMKLDDIITVPFETEDSHIYNQFVISVPKQRDNLRQYLSEAEIGTEIYYPVPLHLQKCFSYLGYKQGDFPKAEHAARSTLALPIYPELSDEQQEYVVQKIKKFYSL
jgi:dTDP-4-amino-4,6-dideoxygalactose transaminase